MIVESLPGGLPYRGHRLFSGVVRAARLPLSGRLVFRLFGGRYGDHRDWDALYRWADGIAGELTAGPSD